MARTVVRENTQYDPAADVIAELVAFGKDRGFVTQGDIIERLPGAAGDRDLLASVTDALAREEVEYVPTGTEPDPGAEELAATAQEVGMLDADSFASDDPSVTDSVKAYLREIGAS